MFRIRQEHIQFLTENRKNNYLQDISDLIKEERPHLFKLFSDQEAWDKEIFARSEVCLEYGLNTVGTIKSFIDITFELGNNFQNDPEFSWAKKIFETDRLNATDKFLCFFNTLRAMPEYYFATDKYTIEKSRELFDLGQYADAPPEER